MTLIAEVPQTTESEDLQILREKIKLLDEENKLLRRVARTAAQKYFAIDPNSEYHAGKYFREKKKVPEDQPITRPMIIAYWMTHKGPEGFANAFGNTETLDIKKLLHALNDGHERTPIELAEEEPQIKTTAA